MDIDNSFLYKFSNANPPAIHRKAIADERWNAVSGGLDSVAPKNFPLKNWNSDDAKAMVYRTSMIESMPNEMTTKQKGGGPALGHTQIEPATYIDMWRYLNNNANAKTPNGKAIKELRDNILTAHSPALTDKQRAQWKTEQDEVISKLSPEKRKILQNFMSNSKNPQPYVPYQQLQSDPELAAVMSRVKYLMRPGAIPSKDNPNAQFNYWKDQYNTNKNIDRKAKKRDWDQRRKSLLEIGDPHAFNNNPINQNIANV